MAIREDNLLDAADDDEEARTAVVSVVDVQGLPDERNRHLLVRMHGENIGQVLLLGEEPYAIGRHQQSNLWITDGGISRRHARIQKEYQCFIIEDLGSVNGTFVNDKAITRHPLKDGDILRFGSVATFRYAVVDSAQEAMLRRLYDTSISDALTGAHNREHFNQRLLGEVSFARRHNTQVALLIFDLDHFKKVNDVYGHPAGDAVLVAVSRSVTSALRAEDIFARYGGEEFAVILRGIDLANAYHVGERIRVSTEAQRIGHQGQVIRVTISVGCASLACCEAPSAEALIATADRRLYAAKRGGRNRVVWEG